VTSLSTEPEGQRPPRYYGSISPVSLLAGVADVDDDDDDDVYFTSCGWHVTVRDTQARRAIGRAKLGWPLCLWFMYMHRGSCS
jgi:hypothetical protein